jgi:hypothetical protein
MREPLERSGTLITEAGIFHDIVSLATSTNLLVR